MATYPQYLVMLVLWQRESCSIKEIGTTLNLDYGTLTPLLKRLESLGFVRRQRRTDDERAVDITLTAEGAALREQAAHIPVEISKALGRTAKQFADLRDLLRLVDLNTAAYSARGQS